MESNKKAEYLKDKKFITLSLIQALLVVYAFVEKETLDKYGSGFGLIVIFGACLALIWIDIAVSYFKKPRI